MKHQFNSTRHTNHHHTFFARNRKITSSLSKSATSNVKKEFGSFPLYGSPLGKRLQYCPRVRLHEMV